ncbi:MAG: ABC transporter permease [Promethearchaeota archaeon]
MSLIKYSAKRLLFAGFAFFAAITIVFVLYHVIPGNPANIFATDPRVPPEVRAQLLERWGLDRPLLEQYVYYLFNLFQGDLGYSFQHQRPVTELILEALPWTLFLLGLSTIISTGIGVLLGAYVAWRRATKLDTAFVSLSLFVNAIPLFFVGMLFLAIFGFQWKIIFGFGFPTYGAITPGIDQYGDPILVALDVLWHAALPLIVLVMYGILSYGWFMRGNIIGVITEDYVQTAISKGLSENEVLFRHCIRNALLPVVTDIGMSFGAIVGGAVIVETVFSYPGTGLLLFNALLTHDYPLVQGGFIIIAGLTLLGLVIAEILYGFIDPRVRVY